MGLFKDFHERGSFVRCLNSTFLLLIPKKKGGVEDLKDFKPVSLIGRVYKLLAKVLANRLKKVMSKLVNTTQNAFVKGRQILDASLIANEVIDSISKKENGILYKLDIEKAYDQINWNFLSTMLHKMGFREKWLGWIKWCISTASFSVMLNGIPEGFFRSSGGLRQGIPYPLTCLFLGWKIFPFCLTKLKKGV